VSRLCSLHRKKTSFVIAAQSRWPLSVAEVWVLLRLRLQLRRRQYTYNSGQLAGGASTQESIAAFSYGTTPFVSSNGTASGIVWMLDHGQPIQDPFASSPTPAILRAYDATNISHLLYSSSQNPADVPGFGIKFTEPIVANGQVFIATAHDPVSTASPQGELDVYGLKH